MSLALALEKISAQQPKERTPVWMVGEQLKDILRAEPHLAELVAQDLDVKDMSIKNCERKIKEYADTHKSGGFACVIPAEADRIIREFYGMPPKGGIPPEPEADAFLSLEDFL